MSWSDVFPLLDDEMVEAYLNQATEEEKATMAQLFEVESVHNRRECGHVVATSLFWKPANFGDPEYPVPSRDLMQNLEHYGLASRYKNPWKHYVEPIFEAARDLAKVRPDSVFRVYLANDLSFLVPDLVDAGCEVHLMKNASINHNPGAMWRFLAMEEGGLVTTTDSDRAASIIHDIERTELMATGKARFWRVPYFIQEANPKVGSPDGYRTILACQFGSNLTLPVSLLCQAFVWNVQKGFLKSACQLGDQQLPIFGTQWPTYGFDEWFLNAAVYPRVAREGVLTFLHWNSTWHNQWLALDIEYCTWANPNSEIMFFGNPEDKTSISSSSIELDGGVELE